MTTADLRGEAMLELRSSEKIEELMQAYQQSWDSLKHQSINHKIPNQNRHLIFWRPPISEEKQYLSCEQVEKIEEVMQAYQQSWDSLKHQSINHKILKKQKTKKTKNKNSLLFKTKTLGGTLLKKKILFI